MLPCDKYSIRHYVLYIPQCLKITQNIRGLFTKWGEFVWVEVTCVKNETFFVIVKHCIVGKN